MARETEALQGTWILTSVEADGQEMSPTAFSGSRIVVAGDKFTSHMLGMTYEGALEVDTSRKPHHLTLLFTAGPQKGTRNPGIYKLAGGKWTICLATRGAKRPSTFATKPDTGLALEVLEREKPGSKGSKAKAAPRSSRKPSSEEVTAAAGPVTALEGDWQMVEAVMDGVAFDAATMKWCQRITRGSLTSVVAGPQTFLKARYTLDDDAHPAAIEYVNLEGKFKGKAQSGSVLLKDGLLKICVAPPGKPRPKEFASKKGDGLSYTAWRRT